MGVSLNRGAAAALLCALCLAPLVAGCGGQGLKADISEYGDSPIEISGLAAEDFSVTPNELAQLECVSRSATGATAKAGTVKAVGPLLDSFLAAYGDGRAMSDFNRIRFIASDGYRVVLRDEYLSDYEVLLSVASGGDPLPEAERPLRILIPEAESGMWEYACVRIEFVE
ncbi:MAG: hypothetical protein LBS32_04045 [Clostridiales Family XIII bacterium]|nr:hypothetical protein [Clostridiales Family XIII bacterium]